MCLTESSGSEAQTNVTVAGKARIGRVGIQVIPGAAASQV